MPLPEAIEQGVQGALDHFHRTLRWETLTAPSHTTVVVAGWNDTDASRQAIAKYLVGLIASAVDAALSIRASLVGNDTRAAAGLEADVANVVGASNDALTAEQKTDERNPWLSEGLWHPCLHVAHRHIPDIHPVGSVLAIDLPHVDAKDHGMDGTVLYDGAAGIGLSFIETKAYRDRPSDAVLHASSAFRAIDRGDKDHRIRQTVQLLRYALPAARQPEIAGAFWNQERTYIPNPHYDQGARPAPSWTRSRRCLARLTPDSRHLIVMPHSIDDFDGFFDTISDAMRSYVRELAHDV